MKIGFSSRVVPDWDLTTITTSAAAMGFDGVELHGLGGESHLPVAGQLVAGSERARRQFADSKVDLVCLSAPTTLSSPVSREIAKQKAVVREFIELAAKLGCPYVRVAIGEQQWTDHHRIALVRVADALGSLVPVASRCRVTLLVENGGGFPSSQDLWFVIDAVGHPALQACWSQCNAKAARERPTVSIPRLATSTGLVHLCDVRFDALGVPIEYKPFGDGEAEVARQIELLKGLAYDRYLVFEPPKMSRGGALAPDVVLPEAAKFIRECIDAEQNVLTAYKGDKYAPKMASRRNVASGA